MRRARTPRRRTEQERMVGVDHVEVECLRQPVDAARVRHRECELRVRRDRDRGVANDPGRGLVAAVQPRAEDPRLVAGRLEASSERLDRDRDASAEWKIVVREERDPHEQKSVRPC
jgi:hypothetical protein